MSRPRLASCSSGGTTVLVLIELKQRILEALGKLGDRDLHELAMDELVRIITEELTPETLAVFLSCLYSVSVEGGGTARVAARREYARLFGTLASCTRPRWLAPHLPKIVPSLVHHLCDPDSSVRDACVFSLAALSERAFSITQPPPSLQLLTTFSKPLLEALGEDSRGVQIGASLCLAKIIESAANNPPIAAIRRLCPRIRKILSSPTLLAKAALLPVIGSLSQVGALNQQHLNMLLPCLHDALKSSDWATRKAAVDTLGRMATNLGPTLATFKSSIMISLESCKFDKVKPVRESIQEAIKIWKALPENMESENAEDIKPESLLSQTAEKSTVEKEESSMEHDKVLEELKKRAPSLAQKKLNPDFFQKPDSRASCDLGIEVAVPRRYPLSALEKLATGREEEGSPFQNGGSIKDPTQFQQSCNLLSGSTPLYNEPTNMGNVQKGDTRSLLQEKINHRLSLDLESCNSPHVKAQHPGNGQGSWYFLHRQICRLQLQQSNVMEMIQGFMDSTEESMLMLESRIDGLERKVDDLSHNVALLSSATMPVIGIGTLGSKYAWGSKLKGGVNRHSSIAQRRLDVHPQSAYFERDSRTKNF